MRQILFYHLKAGKSPVEEFLDTLSERQFEKVAFVKKTQKTPPKEIHIAEQRKKDYFKSKEES